MSEILDCIKNVNRNLIIIGIGPVTDIECWSEISEILKDKLDNSELQCKFISESDNQLFQQSLRTDSNYGRDSSQRITFTQLKFRRSLIQNLINDTEERKKQASLKVSSIPLPVYIIKADEELWFMPNIGIPDALERFKKLTRGDLWQESVNHYFERLLNNEMDGRFVSESKTELLELFDKDRIPRGIYPRDCFYNTDHYQFVIWNFVFSRNGELLIHQRAANAKDNQGMWDKSVGGHIAFEKERDSSVAAARELIEELYTKEKEAQTGHEFSLLSEDLSKILFLGDWLPDQRGIESLNEIVNLEKDINKGEELWAFYKIPGTIEHDTPRILPDSKTEKKLKVLADTFIFIANTLLTHNNVKKLTNSAYMLIEPGTLKSWIENEVDDHGNDFKATPDLKFIMSGKFRDLIDQASQFIKYSNLRK